MQYQADHSDEFFIELKNRVSEAIPEFTGDAMEDEQYMLVFELSEYINAHKEDEAVINKLCIFLDRAVEEGLSFTFDVLNLELFPVLYEDKQLLQRIKNKVTKNTNIVLDFYNLIREKQFEFNRKLSNDF